MTRLHIAIFVDSSRSHAYAIAGLCVELLRRGHRVTYAVADHQTALIRDLGAEPIVFTPPKVEMTDELYKAVALTYKLPPSHPDWWRMFSAIVYPWYFCTTSVVVPQLQLFYKDNKPDLIIYEPGGFAGRILATRLNCRTTQFLPSFFRKQMFMHWENGVACNPKPLVEFARIADSFLWGYGVEEGNSVCKVEPLNIGVISRAFQYDGDSFDERYCFAGPFLNRPFTPVWKDVSNGKPIILITDSPGSNDSDYFNKLIEALAGSRYHVILSTSERVSPSSLLPLPQNFEINYDASHLEIIPSAALLISQAGTGGVLAALYHGVPLITLPLTPMHAEVAYRVESLGLGVSIPRHSVTSEAIRESVDRVMGDSTILRRVTQMRNSLRSSGGEVVAADRIEEFLRAS